MATFMFKGLDELEKQLQKLADSESVRIVCGAAIYAGADTVADAIKSRIESIPVIDYRDRGKDTDKISGILEKQKNGLKESFGITPMAYRDGYYNVKLGFDGYNSIKTKNFPNGQPNQLIARAVNSGTSFREKIPFVDEAVRKAKKNALQNMTKAFDEELKKQIK